MHFHRRSVRPWFGRKERADWSFLGQPSSSAAWCSFSVSAVALCSPTKREVSSMPSPSPLLNPWPDYVAQLPELQWQIERNTCRSRQQISLICFLFFLMILLLFGNATAHQVGVSLESFEICLSSVVFAWSCRPTCPRSLNIVGHKKKSQGPFELHCGKSNQAPSKRASDPPKEKKKRLLAPFSKDRYWLTDSRAPSALWPTGGFGLLQYGATICWENVLKKSNANLCGGIRQ